MISTGDYQMRCLRFSTSLVLVLALGGAVAACGDDDDTTDNAQTGSDASVNEGGYSGRSGTAGKSGSGGSRATAGRSGSAGATAGGAGGARAGAGGSTAGNGGTAGVATVAGRGASAGTGGSTAGNGGTSGTPGAALSDAQIAAVTTAANTGEIQLANLALNRATIPEVRAFAQEMIDMHGAAQARSTALLQALNLVPVMNNLSTQLEQDAQQVATMLQNTQAAGFDLAYVQSQVDIHTQVLEIFDRVLLPSVTAPALRTDLTLARADVQRHLMQAQMLLALVQSTPPDLDAGTEDGGN
jgi:predicted outer membrane protein